MAEELQTYVRSEKYEDHTTISVKVKGSVGQYREFSEEYFFHTNNQLTKMTCVKCGDDEYLGIATEVAWNHMLELKQIKSKKVPTNFFKDLFFKGE